VRGRRLHRLWTLTRKEARQIIRDPSTLLIALVFPVILLLVFGAGINLDSSKVPLGIVVQDDSPAASRLADAFAGSPSFELVAGQEPAIMGDHLRAGKLRGFVVIRGDFSRHFAVGATSAPGVLLETDGSEPNTASFVGAYVAGVFGAWQRSELARSGRSLVGGYRLETRAWFNPTTESRNFLLPGSITIIMTVVGALLTALVIAREWERGTMEALLAAGVTRFELLAFKLVPYFVLGMISFSICIAVTVLGFGVPLHGSLRALFLVGSMFLISALGIGLLLSTALRDQFNAAQAALNVAFLPALMLSGFIFEISSMPSAIRAVSRVIPARYFVSAMQTIFQAGDVWSVIGPALIGLTVASLGFLGLTFLITKRRLE
jgi:ABC-2 type transport system permease protein